MVWTRSRKWKAAAVAGVLAVVAVAIAGRRMAAELVMERLRSEARSRYGLDVRADGVALSLLRGTAVFEGLRVLDGRATVLEAERIEVEARVLDALRGRLDGLQLTVLRPVLRVVVEEDGRTNLQRLREGARGEAASGPGALVILREGTVAEGRIEVLDAVTDPDRPLRLEVRGIRGSASGWQLAGEPVAGLSGDLLLDGEVAQPDFPARISVVAWGSPAGGPPARTLLAVVTGFDLRRVPQYVGAAGRAALGGDFLHVGVDVRSRGGVIGPGAVLGEVAGSGTLLPMRVGGTTADPVFDVESPLATLLRVPLSRLGGLGAVTLDAGWSLVKGGGRAAADLGGGVVDAGASLGSGLVNAGGALFTGDPLGALAEAGGGGLGVVTSIGGGIVKGAASLFGGGSEAVSAVAGENPGALRLRFAERHGALRLNMRRAARTRETGPAQDSADGAVTAAEEDATEKR